MESQSFNSLSFDDVFGGVLLIFCLMILESCMVCRTGHVAIVKRQSFGFTSLSMEKKDHDDDDKAEKEGKR